ncbi:MAG: tRNA preQ1(34) S-adenosylmethionine ribosyltransferase-isomerase QueA [Chloroflexota bacterium]|nr:tRNA preQ1(34) S-adenosylmethionine ribosyltransferase-isomerase QueA [Chloroflexota bacterium]
MNTSDFDYELPQELIAQTPIEPRDHSRLLVVGRTDESIAHRHFYELPDLLRKGDVLVFNDSRVLPARLLGHRVGYEGKVEILLLRRIEPSLWEVLVKPSRRISAGDRVELDGLQCEVLERKEGAIRIVRFSDEEALERAGKVPLPPYIHSHLDSPERYQTVYARVKGSAAAPTAGLHFTPDLLHRLEERGVDFAFVTLHVGLDTFVPVRVDDPQRHHIHREYCQLSAEVAQQLSQARADGRRIVAVGTTSVRVLEQAALGGTIQPFDGWNDLLILPGHRFNAVDVMITNFHLPRTTLIMMVSAFADRDSVLRAYEAAIEERYRFYSFGDAMLIV